MTNTTNRPTHRVFYTDDRGRGGSDLIEIGGAWPTKSGDGLNIRLPFSLPPGSYISVVPIDWTEIDARRQAEGGR